MQSFMFMLFQKDFCNTIFFLILIRISIVRYFFNGVWYAIYRQYEKKNTSQNTACYNIVVVNVVCWIWHIYFKHINHLKENRVYCLKGVLVFKSQSANKMFVHPAVYKCAVVAFPDFVQRRTTQETTNYNANKSHNSCLTEVLAFCIPYLTESFRVKLYIL